MLFHHFNSILQNVVTADTMLSPRADVSSKWGRQIRNMEGRPEYMHDQFGKPTRDEL